MKLIKINTDHYVVVDDSEIKPLDWCLDTNTNLIFQYYTKRGLKSTDKKITHSTQPESLGMGWMQSVLPLFLLEVKELISEVDVEKKAIKDLESYFGSNLQLTDSGKDWVDGYGIGYNQALEDNKEKKYTEEDLKYMFECGRNYQNNAEITFKVSMEYLQPKTEWEVEIVDGKLKLI